jgi:alpha-tubulin suppressor-like RCC1 family protein
MLPDRVLCWGANDSGQIGNGSTGGGVAAPSTVLLTAIAATVDLAAGSNHNCAIVSGPGIDGTNGVRCWGANGSGQIDGSGANHPSPVNVKFFNSPKLPDAVAAGRAHSCAKRGTDGACIGDNSLGQTSISATPNMGGPISAGGDHTCYVDATNELQCFGSNQHSELGPFGP